MATVSGSGARPRSGSIVSPTSRTPLTRMNTATAVATHPSGEKLVNTSMTEAASTAPVEITSLRLSAAAAFSVPEPMRFSPEW